MSKLLVALALIVAFSAPAVAAFGKAQSNLTSDASSLHLNVNGRWEMPNADPTGSGSAILIGCPAITPPPITPTTATRRASTYPILTDWTGTHSSGVGACLVPSEPNVDQRTAEGAGSVGRATIGVL